MLSGLENGGLLAGTSKKRHCHGKEASTKNGTCLQFASGRDSTETTSNHQRFKFWLSFDNIHFTLPFLFFRHNATPRCQCEKQQIIVRTWWRRPFLFCCSSFLDCIKTQHIFNQCSHSLPTLRYIRCEELNRKATLSIFSTNLKLLFGIRLSFLLLANPKKTTHPSPYTEHPFYDVVLQSTL